MRLREKKSRRDEEVKGTNICGEPSTEACQLIRTSANCRLLRPYNTGTDGSLLGSL